MVKYTCEQKDLAVKDLLLRKKTVKEIADNIGVDRVTLYNLKNQKSEKEADAKVKLRIKLSNSKKSLEMKVLNIKKLIHILEIGKDILEKTADI